jgi:LAO/AO transport system kinase
MSQIEQILAGDRLALARAITRVENENEEARRLVEELFLHSGRGHVIGITGASGAGKSTLVNALVKRWLSRHPSTGIGIIAVDPTSPFSGGALLGDRVRMKDIASDSRVFVRSMATRGALGGLNRSVPAVIHMMDAAGLDPILVETVGAGQSEVEIARVAHSTVVVEAPGLGDDVQAIKAGILEIADILVVNKADKPGADLVVQSLKAMLELGYPPSLSKADSEMSSIWIPPILKTVATEEDGMDMLLDQIEKHRQFICVHGQWQKKEQRRLEAWMESLYTERIGAQWQKVTGTDAYREILSSLLSRQLSPFRAIEELVKKKEKSTS